MDKALSIGGRNPLGKMASKVYKFLLSVGPKSATEILVEFIDDISQRELDEVLDYLRASNQVRYSEKTGKYIANEKDN